MGTGQGWAGRRAGTRRSWDRGEKPSRAASWERFGHLGVAGIFIKQRVLKIGDQVPEWGCRWLGHSVSASLPRRDGDGASTPQALPSLSSAEIPPSERNVSAGCSPPSAGHRGTDVLWEGSAWTLSPTSQPVFGAWGLPTPPAQRSRPKKRNA